MNLYKAYLNNEYKLISYGVPEAMEKIPVSEKTYDISFKDIEEYIELFGYLKIPYKLSNGVSYMFFIDLDYNIINPFEEQIISYILDQIKDKNRRKAIKELFDNIGEDYPHKGEIVDNYISDVKESGIKCNDIMEVGDFSYLYHNTDGGKWATTNSNIIEIVEDKLGLIYCKSPGVVTVSYKVKTNEGSLSCFKKVQINERK